MSSMKSAIFNLGYPVARRGFSNITGALPTTPDIQKNKAERLNKLGGKYRVTLIPGDGIGQEISESVKRIFKSIAVPIEWEQFDVSGFTTHNENLFKQSIDSLRRNKVGLKGILYTPVSKLGHSSFNVTMRQDLDIYASLAVCKTIPGLPTKHPAIDVAIIRENTEGEYTGLEHQSIPGVVESLKIITKSKTERITKFALDFALKNNRKKITCIHKANIMKLTDGLFLSTYYDIAKKYYSNSGLDLDDMIIDNTAMQLVSRPNQFDVMLMPNLYGSILSNIAAALVGGPGVIPGCNIGREYAIFEPGCRHVAKDIQGRNTANPTSFILSAVMMLRHLELDDYADLIAAAVYKTLANPATRTPDLGGSCTTTDFTLAVIENLSV